MLEIEIELEKEAGLITEAINDIITIACLNNQEQAFDIIKKQFLVINRQDLKKD